jgi:hypothetical protein
MIHTGIGFVLDGNASASILQEIFLREITAARLECRRCGSAAAVGASRLYSVQMGAVLRCGACENMLLRAVHTPHGCWLEMSGVRSLRFDSETHLIRREQQ